MILRMIPLVVAIALAVGCKKSGSTNSDGDVDPNATYTLKLRDEQQGDKTEVTETITGTGETNFGGKTEKEQEDKKIVFTQEILEMPVAGEKPTKLTRKYTVAQQYDKKAKMQKSLPIEGKTVTIERKGDKYEFTSDGKKMGFLDTLPLLNEFDNSKKSSKKLDDLLPKSAVKIGESWNIDLAAFKGLSGESPFALSNENSKLTGKLLRVYNKDGKQWGVISFDLAATLDSNPKKGKGTLDGTIKADGTFDTIIDGSARDGTLRMNMKMSLAAKADGKEARVSADVVQEKTIKTLK